MTSIHHGWNCPCVAQDSPPPPPPSLAYLILASLERDGQRLTVDDRRFAEMARQFGRRETLGTTTLTSRSLQISIAQVRPRLPWSILLRATPHTNILSKSQRSKNSGRNRSMHPCTVLQPPHSLRITSDTEPKAMKQDQSEHPPSRSEPKTLHIITHPPITRAKGLVKDLHVWIPVGVLYAFPTSTPHGGLIPGGMVASRQDEEPHMGGGGGRGDAKRP